MNTEDTRLLMEQADSYLDEGNLKMARQMFQRVCELDPGHAEAWMMTGVIDIDIGNFNEAEKMLNRSIEIDGSYADPNYFMATLLLKKNDIQGAYSYCEKAVRLDPDFNDAKNMLEVLSAQQMSGTISQPVNQYQTSVIEGNRLYAEGKYQEALACFKSALDLNNSVADIWRICGDIHWLLNQHEDALEHYEKALSITPEDAILRSKYAAVLAAGGKTDDSMSQYRRAIELQPTQLKYYDELSALMVSAGLYDDAVSVCQKALQVDSSYVNACNNIGKIYLFYKNQPELAGEYFNRSLEIDASSASAHQGLARVLFNQGNVSDAISELETAVKLEPARVEYLNNLAAFQVFSGELDRAMSTYNIVTDIEPENTEAIAGKAEVYQRMRRYQESYDIIMGQLERGVRSANTAIVMSNICGHLDKCSEAIGLIEEMMSQDHLPADARRPLHYALGRLYDADGRHMQAFEQYTAANELDVQDFDATAHSAFVDAIISSTQSVFQEGVEIAGSDCNRPIFILGMPRSGTSLVEQILATHEDVYGAGELDIIRKMVAELSFGDRPYPSAMDPIDYIDYVSLGDAYCDAVRQINDEARHITDKMPDNFLHMGLICRMLPSAHIIHCTRHPLDTILSIYFQAFGRMHTYASDLLSIARYYVGYERLMRHWLETIPMGRVLEVRYESLVGGQEAMTRAIIEYCGLGWDDRCLDFHNTDRAVATASYDQVRRPIYSSSVGRWQNYRDQLAPVIEYLQGAGIWLD